MDPPRMTQTDKAGGAGFIASLLQLVGLTGDKAAGGGKQEAAPAEFKTPEIKEETKEEAAARKSNLPALDSVESAFVPLVPLPMDWGKRYLDAVKPIIQIDPNDALK
ncbi:MAG: hypothetical protein ACRCZI_09735 [Cetobacterium sp.]